MNRSSRAPIPDVWRRSVEAYHARIALRRLGRIAESQRIRMLDEIERNASAAMSPFADARDRRRPTRESAL